MGSARSRVKSHSKFVQTMRSSRGWSSLGRSAKESGPKRVPHQGQFSSGMGEGLPFGIGLELPAPSRVPNPSGRPLLCPRMLGWRPFLPRDRSRRAIRRSGRRPFSRSSSSAHTSPAARDELIEREKPQRVAHDHAHPGARQPLLARMPQSSSAPSRRLLGPGMPRSCRRPSGRTAGPPSRGWGRRGSARPGRFSRMKASWKARQSGALRSRGASGARAPRRDSPRGRHRGRPHPGPSTAIPRSIRSAATPARYRSSSSAVSRRTPLESRDVSLVLASIQARYCATSGTQRRPGGVPHRPAPRASPSQSSYARHVQGRPSSPPRRSGIHAVRSRWHAPSTSLPLGRHAVAGGVGSGVSA